MSCSLKESAATIHKWDNRVLVPMLCMPSPAGPGVATGARRSSVEGLPGGVRKQRRRHGAENQIVTTAS